MDPGALSFFTTQLSHGAMSRLQFTRFLTGSQEYRQNEVQTAFQVFLHRAPDGGAVNFYTNFLGSGGTVEQLDAALIGSPEYFAVEGGGTNAGFVNALFHDALHRAADSSASAFFTGLLARGTRTGDVASQILNTDEYRRQLADLSGPSNQDGNGQPSILHGWYQYFLRRNGDAGGINFVVNSLRSGARDETMVASFVAADEYFARL